MRAARPHDALMVSRPGTASWSCWQPSSAWLCEDDPRRDLAAVAIGVHALVARQDLVRIPRSPVKPNVGE
jgi:hypothetical protein